jgi:hypothetical protein
LSSSVTEPDVLAGEIAYGVAGDAVTMTSSTMKSAENSTSNSIGSSSVSR